MYLLSGDKAPDYSTIARFRNGRLDGVTEDLFRQLVEKLHERGDTRFDKLFVDGTEHANRTLKMVRKMKVIQH